MKLLSVCAVLLISVFTDNRSVAQSAVTKETIKVWGNCSKCKKNIEKSAKSAGAVTASWNEKTKLLYVSYAAANTSDPKIQQAIAKAGYDTQDYSADMTAYNHLDECCQYERKTSAVNGAAAPKPAQ